jgi:hypothetical protein
MPNMGEKGYMDIKVCSTSWGVADDQITVGTAGGVGHESQDNVDNSTHPSRQGTPVSGSWPT